MINFVCVLKTGGVYNLDYVVKLHNSLRRNTTRINQFICLTDTKEVLVVRKQAYGIQFWNLPENYPKWWSKLEAFKITDKVLYIDLDTVILNTIDPLIELIYKCKENEFYVLRQLSMKRNPLYPLTTGIMGWNGDWSHLTHNFNLIEESKRFPYGDDMWTTLSLKKHKAVVKTFQEEVNGIYSYKYDCKEKLPSDARIVCFHGKPKPHEIENEWITTHWR